MSHPVHRKKHSWLGHPVTVILLVGVCALALYSLFGMYQKYRQAIAAKDVYVREREDLHKQKQELSASITNLNSERGREEEIRSRFRAVRPGESLIVVVEEDANIGIDENEDLPFMKRVWKKITCVFDKEC